jgi:hypothetical protein
MVKKNFVALGFCLMISAIFVSGCEPDKKNYSCEEAVELLYDQDCGLWCDNDSDWIYLNTCAWYDMSEYETFTKDDAEYVCGLIDDGVNEGDCDREYKDLMNCLVEERKNYCAEDCDDEAEALWDCLPFEE